MFYFIFFLSIFLLSLKLVNLRRLYFYLYSKFADFQAYFDQRYRSFFTLGLLSPRPAQFYFFPKFFFLPYFSPFAMEAGHLYFITFSRRRLILHPFDSNYFVYFFFFIYFMEPKFIVYNFYNYRIFIFL